MLDFDAPPSGISMGRSAMEDDDVFWTPPGLTEEDRGGVFSTCATYFLP